MLPEFSPRNSHSLYPLSQKRAEAGKSERGKEGGTERGRLRTGREPKWGEPCLNRGENTAIMGEIPYLNGVKTAYMEAKTLLEWGKTLKKAQKKKYFLTRIKNSARLELEVRA